MIQAKKYLYLLSFCFLLLVVSCQQPGGDTTGSEYMPDMAHSVAYEANYYNYYYNNTWGSEDEYYKMAKPREPIPGTIARGYAGGMEGQASSDNAISVPRNGAVPYYYADTEEDRVRAIAEIIDNPYPITDKGIEKGKELYTYFCAICHGDKADGAGYLVRDDGGVYPVQPAILNNEEFTAASNGRFYHSIMYGKNLMGGYADKLSYEERWQVIHYIRQLQAKTYEKEYNQYVNTLNSIDRPAGDIPVKEVTMTDDLHQEGDHQEDNDHNDGSH
jgi:mono/diheme cytochrome c family protein